MHIPHGVAAGRIINPSRSKRIRDTVKEMRKIRQVAFKDTVIQQAFDELWPIFRFRDGAMFNWAHHSMVDMLE